MTTVKKILLVEDDNAIAKVEACRLEAEGYLVLRAAGGEEAVNLMDAGAADDICLAVMDIDLGEGIDGITAAELILKKRHLPIVFMSSHIEAEIIEKIKKITPHAYVVKSSGGGALADAVKKALERN